MVSSNLFKKPWHYRVFPAIGFSIQRGCVYIGNPYIPKIMVFTFSSGTGVMTTEKPPSSLDYYREIFQFSFSNFNLNIIPNKDYTEEKLAQRKTEETE